MLCTCQNLYLYNGSKMAREKPCSPAGSKIHFENAFYKYSFALYPQGCVAYRVTKTYLKPLQITSKTLVLVSDILWHHVQEGKPSLCYSQPASAPQKRINQSKKENPYGSFNLCLPWQECMRLLHPQNKWHWDEMVPHSFLIGSSFHLCKQNISVSSNRG